MGLAVQTGPETGIQTVVKPLLVELAELALDAEEALDAELALDALDAELALDDDELDVEPLDALVLDDVLDELVLDELVLDELDELDDVLVPLPSKVAPHPTSPIPRIPRISMIVRMVVPFP
jgi:hypothetical protein